MTDHHQVLIVGGGTAGLSIAARLRAVEHPPEVAIIEPSDKHYYQPIWTLVGAGVFPKEVSVRDEADFIPPGATWIRDAVATFEPDKNQVTTKAGKTLTYDQLVVAAGIQLDWDAITGLRATLGKNGVCSNYSYDTVDSTWDNIRSFKGGTALFTFPATLIKCAGAPQKIMYLAEHAFRRQGVRDKTRVVYGSATPAIFGVPKYRAALEKIVASRKIETMFQHDLVEVRGEAKEAVFVDKADGSRTTVKYDMLHVTPPQSAPDFIKQSPLAGPGGWVEVDKHTTQHVRFPNVFSAGDCSSLPTSKTGAAVRKEAPVLVDNLLALRAGRPLTASYDGYASCPLVTGYGTVMLAEFGYDGKIMETFPFDQAQERYSMWALKAYALPSMYWHGMLRGRM
jgi:sulfide:quinone oxidoreductase